MIWYCLFHFSFNLTFKIIVKTIVQMLKSCVCVYHNFLIYRKSNLMWVISLVGGAPSSGEAEHTVTTYTFYSAKWDSTWVYNFPREARFQMKCSLYLFYISCNFDVFTHAHVAIEHALVPAAQIHVAISLVRSDIHCECSKSITYVTRTMNIEYLQWITERSLRRYDRFPKGHFYQAPINLIQF